MTLIVNKEIMLAHGLCGPGLDNFINVLGKGDESFTLDLEAAIAHVAKMEETNPQFSAQWVRNLRKSFKFYKMQGAYTMTDKFKVFNQKAGRHEEFLTLEEAIARRQEILNEFVADNPHMFVINREVLLDGGPDTMWVPIKDLPPADAPPASV